MERQPEGAGPETTGNQQPAEAREQLQEAPRIYVASLSDYNDGRLHGTWIDATQPREDLQRDVQAMLAASPVGHAEEIAIHDYEGFGQYPVAEYDSLERVNRIAHGIAEHGLAYAAWAARCEPDELDRFEEAYSGDWSSTEDYADDLIDSLGLQQVIDQVVPDGLRPYVTVDARAFVRDLELSGMITTITHADGVWIFDGSM
jgi:antirestriction protein